MTDTRPDPTTFHEADYADYDAMLDGLTEAIWDEVNPTGEQTATSSADATAYIIFIWVKDQADGDGLRVRAARGAFEDDDDDDLMERLDPDFYITTYDDEPHKQIYQDLDEVMSEFFEDDDDDGDGAG